MKAKLRHVIEHCIRCQKYSFNITYSIISIPIGNYKTNLQSNLIVLFSKTSIQMTNIIDTLLQSFYFLLMTSSVAFLMT